MQYAEERDTNKPAKPISVPAPGFATRISTREVFERMIEHELRSGRLTRGRRRRIVRYAARLGMSAVEAGRFLETCRANALTSADPAERSFALRLADPPTTGESWISKLTVAVAAGVLLALLLTVWSR